MFGSGDKIVAVSAVAMKTMAVSAVAATHFHIWGLPWCWRVGTPSLPIRQIGRQLASHLLQLGGRLEYSTSSIRDSTRVNTHTATAPLRQVQTDTLCLSRPPLSIWREQAYNPIL